MILVSVQVFCADNAPCERPPAKAGGKAIALIELDEAISDDVLGKVRDLEQVTYAKRLGF